MKKAVPTGKKKAAPRKKNAIMHMVAIGASAGGLEAVSRLLKYLPSNTGMAYFYVQHLSPNHPSNLSEILSRATKMPVLEVKNNMKIEQDHVYVCTPNQEMMVANNKIKLSPRVTGVLPYLPIDRFFGSLAKEYGDSSIGVVLSGNATDGSAGLKQIREAGGITFAQDSSAKYDGMPKSAIEMDAVEFVLSPKEIARRLGILGRRGVPGLQGKRHELELVPDNSPELKTILAILYKVSGVDFSYYKHSALKRRLSYRMLHGSIETIQEYARLLARKPDEVKLLYKDLLINVTSFFRDPETFEYLKSTFLPKLFKSKEAGQSVRIWVAACSTGQEVYSIAMLISELRATHAGKIPVKIFASDLSEQAIRIARQGEYSEDDLKSVSKSRIKRFFTRTGDRYRVNKELRELCVFAEHNILSDPPFSRIDFISCCNLLIYFDQIAQKKALATMSFALNEVGYLMLGKSETTGPASSLYTQTSTRFKIYTRKRQVGTRRIPQLMQKHPLTNLTVKKQYAKTKIHAPTDSKELDAVIDQLLLDRYMPACAVINKDLEILKFRGSTSVYLSHTSGNASLNILKMALPEFAFELRNVLHKAFQTKTVITKPDVEIRINSRTRLMTLEVSPLNTDWDQPLLAVVFKLQDEQKEAVVSGKGKHLTSPAKDLKIRKLTEELNTTRLEMHTIIQSQETAFEELQAANEEIVSTNEEFQTLNEELETSKEEIEATNEELISTNQELQVRNDLLTESYTYSEAIIETIHEPLIVLDKDLCVRSANKAYYKVFKVTHEETEGSLLYELGNNQWDRPALRKLLTALISKNRDFNEFEVKHNFPVIGEKIMLLNAHRLVQKTHGEQLILLAIEDITERALHFQKEKEILQTDIRLHKADKLELEDAVKRRTKQLEHKNVELEDANKDLTSFTYVSSHDLQEPLRKIKNFVSILLTEEKKKLSADGKQYLQRTYETAQRMQTLIEDLLTYSRTKNLERKFENTDLEVLFREVESEHEEALIDKNAVIIHGKLNHVNVIRFQFRQLLQNLLSNSLKFSKPGLPLHIHIRSRIIKGSSFNLKHRTTDKRRLIARTDYCQIIYTDDGIGFDPLYNERIFHVFQRLHSQEDYMGTGMGLAICQRIAENHNGIITANGKLNKGARFDIYIPVVRPNMPG